MSSVAERPAPPVPASAPSEPGRRPTTRRRRRNPLGRAGALMFLPFAAVFVATVIVPLGYAVGLSLFQSRFIGGEQFVWLGNYASALTDPALYEGLGRVLLFMAIQVPVILVLALVISIVIDSGRLAMPGLFRLGIFIPYAIPTVVAALMWGYLYGRQFGLIGQTAGALGLPSPDFLSPELIIPAMANISIWQFTGYNMLIFYAGLQSIPRELYEAAAIDGAGQLRIAWSIKLPALLPSILLAGFFSIIGGIQLFTEPSILRSLAPTVISSDYTPALYMYNLAVKGSRFEYAAALAVTIGVVTILAILLVQLVQRLRAGRKA
jgi:multiple sugar transport system permease protein